MINWIHFIFIRSLISVYLFRSDTYVLAFNLTLSISLKIVLSKSYSHIHLVESSIYK